MEPQTKMRNATNRLARTYYFPKVRNEHGPQEEKHSDWADVPRAISDDEDDDDHPDDRSSIVAVDDDDLTNEFARAKNICAVF